MTQNSLDRFMLSNGSVRGEIVSLAQGWREVVSRHAFPESVRNCLGELCAAALLLSASLKFDGTLVLQIHGDGPVALLVVECDADGQFRATAKLREGQVCPEDADLTSLVNAHGKGRFVVTLDPRTDSPNRQPYQGIVPFEGNSVSEVLEHYMARSEQVPTRLWVAADGERSVGLLLQRLPEEGGKTDVAPRDEDGWNRLQKLASTVTRDELLGLPPEQVLHRLFWQEPLQAFERREPRFACSCSRDKVASMLRMLGREEVESIIAERGTVSVHCEFCNTPYEFDLVDSAGLFIIEPQVPGSQARH